MKSFKMTLIFALLYCGVNAQVDNSNTTATADKNENFNRSLIALHSGANIKAKRSKYPLSYKGYLSPHFKSLIETDTIKKVKFAIIPLVNYSNTFGVVGGVMVSAFYKLNQKDTISPSSSTTLMGVYSSSKTYMAMAIQQLYFNKDNWRMKFGLGIGEVFFQTYQHLPNNGGGYWNEEGIWINYNTSMTFFFASLQRQTIPNLYAGAESMFSFSRTEFDITNPITGDKPTSDSQMNSLGYNLLYDTRDNVNFPVKGFFIQYRNNFVREWMGSSDNFDRYELAFNYFWDVKKNNKTILVSRFFADIASGDVPFQGENVIGRDDLRGYSQGKYRGKQIYAIQAELRQNLYKKFGVVGFLGLGSAVNQISEISDAELLPSIGLGLRYVMIPKEKINIGIDVGLGKDDWSLSFRIGETFGK